MGIWRLLRSGQIVALVREARLGLRLLRDPRVPRWSKLLAGLGLLYILVPLDLFADLFPLAGQIDDLAILLFVVDTLVRSAPPGVVDEHRAALARRVRA